MKLQFSMSERTAAIFLAILGIALLITGISIGNYQVALGGVAFIVFAFFVYRAWLKMQKEQKEEISKYAPRKKVSNMLNELTQNDNPKAILKAMCLASGIEIVDNNYSPTNVLKQITSILKYLYESSSIIDENMKKANLKIKELNNRIDKYFAYNPSYKERFLKDTIKFDNAQLSVPFFLELFLSLHSRLNIEHLINSNLMISNYYNTAYFCPISIYSKEEFEILSEGDKIQEVNRIKTILKKKITEDDMELLNIIEDILYEVNSIRKDAEHIMHGVSQLDDMDLKDYPMIKYSIKYEVQNDYNCNFKPLSFTYFNSYKKEIIESEYIHIYNIVETIKSYVKSACLFSFVQPSIAMDFSKLYFTKYKIDGQLQSVRTSIQNNVARGKEVDNIIMACLNILNGKV